MSLPKKNPVPEGTPAPQPIMKCTYVQSQYCRVVGADGVYGGISPQGMIEMAFFTERYATPDETQYPITAEGGLGDEITASRVGREGIERELEIRVLLRRQTAEVLIGWLKGNLDRLDAIEKELQKKK